MTSKVTTEVTLRVAARPSWAGSLPCVIRGRQVEVIRAVSLTDCKAVCAGDEPTMVRLSGVGQNGQVIEDCTLRVSMETMDVLAQQWLEARGVLPLAHLCDAWAACPVCGNRDTEYLLFDDDEDLHCERCGTVYDPVTQKRASKA